MTQRESTLTRAWRETDTVRRSLVWWLLAVASSATLAVAGYFAALGGAPLLFALAGVVIGFFTPYALALVWNVLGAYGRQTEVT
jgi:hypothetical protein